MQYGTCAPSCNNIFQTESHSLTIHLTSASFIHNVSIADITLSNAEEEDADITK